MTLADRVDDILKTIHQCIEQKNSRLMAPEDKQQEIQSLIHSCIAQAPEEEQSRLHAEFFSSGPLEALMVDKQITEVMVTPKTVHFEKNGCIFKCEDSFLSDFTFTQFTHRLASESNTHTTLQKPFADGSWNDFRVHTVRSPIADNSIIITLRRHSGSHWNFQNLVDTGMINSDLANILKTAYRQRKNILIVGPTGCGKTTLINALIQESFPTERIVSIEDTDELCKPNDVSVKLLTRDIASESLPVIGQQALLHQALRMRPDRILVGEVRGPEAKDLLLTLSTGHSGFVGSLHAKSAREALWRLEMLIQMGAPQWTTDTIRRLIQFSLEYVIVVERQKNQRRINEVMRLVSLEAHGFLLEPVYQGQTETSR